MRRQLADIDAQTEKDPALERFSPGSNAQNVVDVYFDERACNILLIMF